MAGGKAKKAPGQTWSGLDEDDLTGQAEAEEAQLIEFGRRSQDPPKEQPDTKERRRCPRKPRR
jgi:hypothetical protein